MDVQNPYQSPAGDTSPVSSDETYLPQMFALKGRIGRLRYMAYSFGTSFVLMMIAAILAIAASAIKADKLMLLVVIAMYAGIVVFTIALTVRRLNDMDRSGWLSLLFMVPLINLILWLVLMLAPGTPTANRFGLKPAPNTRGIVIAGLMVPVGIFLIGVLAAISIPAYQNYVTRAKQQQQINLQMQQIQQQGDIR
ncbi:uncharacterized membrane protein YhaH (DUF805 family) [Fluviicoccus keumensis]|uniref:Uncharacterized membrane protein YhaH (DUF805 family) n=1 Tax=Fluviicoccus keumensis TaxID=1435465 RepID=A0A4V2G5Z9_9GAMM|nr:DUF805 domain-containing protein [Fluviicoccus keumensis]RZU46756.1 uncharacterized membrane protein YhaH (DUF805 family) [Fluviicoccus keumensis]